eukprot:GABV01013639.1.p2 GENE.GABV01013639.1~~GABV01013639.1.p2  ORF type:complete len:113 (-),score=23.84 GABV01013639.1:3-341(-)
MALTPTLATPATNEPPSLLPKHPTGTNTFNAANSTTAECIFRSPQRPNGGNPAVAPKPEPSPAAVPLPSPMPTTAPQSTPSAPAPPAVPPNAPETAPAAPKHEFSVIPPLDA